MEYEFLDNKSSSFKCLQEKNDKELVSLIYLIIQLLRKKTYIISIANGFFYNTETLLTFQYVAVGC